MIESLGAELPRDRYDVAVVGAGAAGVTAAAAAASAGAGVVLIEASGRLGGSVTGAMHRSLCGLYAAAPKDAIDTLNAGSQRQLVSGMKHIDPAHVIPRELGKSWVLEFPAPAWESALNGLSTHANVDRLLNCKVCHISRNNGLITGLDIEGMRRGYIDVSVVIDCTGRGSAIQLCGDDVGHPIEPVGRMLGGYALRLAGINGNLEMLRIQTPYVLSRAVVEGKLPPEARFTMFHPGPGADEGICKLAIRPDQFGQEDVEVFANSVFQHLKANLQAFAQARVIETSPGALARDGIRLRGQYVVTEDDVLTARRHGKDAVHAWWPIERWDPKQGPNYIYPPHGEHYDIPPGALRSAVIPNLLAAGTCVSATSGAAASIRASGICLATGHAAGTMAASIAGSQ